MALSLNTSSDFSPAIALAGATQNISRPNDELTIEDKPEPSSINTRQLDNNATQKVGVEAKTDELKSEDERIHSELLALQARTRELSMERRKLSQDLPPGQTINMFV